MLNTFPVNTRHFTKLTYFHFGLELHLKSLTNFRHWNGDPFGNHLEKHNSVENNDISPHT